MNEVCKAIIVGSILGDGHVTRVTSRLRLSQMEFKYSDKSFEYLKWFYDSLSCLGLNPVRSHPNKQHYFRIRSSAEIGEFRELFYKDGVKIIPNNIKSLLTNPLTLAVWYMDDGTFDNREKYHCNPLIATYSFTFQECKLLVQALNDNFGIHASVTKCVMRGKVYPRLYIWSESTIKFFDIVRPYILPCMKYKII